MNNLKKLLCLACALIFVASAHAGKNDIQFQKDGHKYTTFLVGRLAGVPEDELYLLTFYSEYPDLDCKYSAVAVSLKYLLVLWKWGWRSDITKQLHSLHGGKSKAVQSRRKGLQNLIRSNMQHSASDAWKTGLLIHALADAFAHTKGPLDTTTERAYGTLCGHLFDSTEPDTIGNPEVFPKYAQYVRMLYSALSRDQQDSGAAGIEAYLKHLEQFVGNPSAMRQAIFDFCKEFAPIDQARFDAMEADEELRLTKTQVQQAMDEIKVLPRADTRPIVFNPAAATPE